ncbi:MAG: TerB family tellurite resistance protein [Chitinophagales bacterium]
MSKYDKWLGAGIGWVVGGPWGGILGYLAGNLTDSGQGKEARRIANGISEFETNLIVLATHLMRIDGRVTTDEIDFTKTFLNTHFDSAFAEERSRILQHCIDKDYDLNVVCEQIRLYTNPKTKTQVVQFLLDLATSDGELSERENYFIFRIAGYINVNDVEFRKIKAAHIVERPATAYDLLGVKPGMSMDEIRTAYRKLVLKFHPDRNKNLDEAAKKDLARKFQEIKEAYNLIKKSRAAA